MTHQAKRKAVMAAMRYDEARFDRVVFVRYDHELRAYDPETGGRRIALAEGFARVWVEC